MVRRQEPEVSEGLYLTTLSMLCLYSVRYGAGPAAVLWALPFAGGLLGAIPFCVATADPAVSAWLRRHRLAAIPEELPA